MWDLQSFYIFMSKNYDEYNSRIMDLTHSKWMIQLMSYVDGSKNVKKHNNMLKYKCEVLKLCVFQYILINIIWKIWIYFNKFNSCIHVDSSRDVKKLTKPSSIIVKHKVACVSIYSNKCKMQHVSNNFDILKMNGSTHIHMLIIEKMWKKSLIHSSINMRS